MRETTYGFVSKQLATVLQRNFPNLKNDFKKLFILPLFILMMVFVQQGHAQVSVTATAGTLGPTSYTTVNAAFTAINAGTHRGIINITVTANTTEPATPVPLNNSGAGSAVYTNIHIRPGSAGIVINSAATPTSGRAIIELLGADNVTIDGSSTIGGTSKDLTIQAATSANPNACIRLSSNSTTGLNGANNDTIRNCNIVGPRASATAAVPNFGIIFSDASASLAIGTGAYSSVNTYISNNNITRAFYGIVAQGSSATYPNTGTQIIGNTIGSATSANNIGLRGILLTFTAVSSGGAIIDGNDIRCGDYGATGYTNTIAGIEVGTVNYGVIIRKNNIHDINQPNSSGYGAHGIYITGATNNTLSTIENNFIRDCKMVIYQNSPTSTFIPCGVFFTAGATGVKFNHNTVVMNQQLAVNTGYTSICVNASVSGVAFSQFYNNILVNNHNSSAAFCIYTAATGNISAASMNNNNYYYVSTGNVGFYNAAARQTLTAWQTATSKDGASLNVNPPFTSTTDLHIPNGTSTTLESGGISTATTGITTDVDGETRPNTGSSLPDIGADEFAVYANDAGITGLVSTSFCPGTQNVQVVLKNFGTATLTSAKIDWTVNGAAQTQYSWTGSLAPGATANVTIGSFAFAPSTNYTIVATSSLPNGTTDLNSSNNAFTSSTFQTSLSGTYTVGTSGNFTTLTAAVAAANAYGLCGPTVFNLTNTAAYSGSETFPITINQLSGSSATNTLTIKPNTTATISGAAASGALIKLNGADYIIIDGSNSGASDKSLTITNTSTTAPTAVSLISLGTGLGATNNIIKNCNISTGVNSTVGYGVAIGGATPGTSGADNDNNTVQDNVITIAAVGVYSVGTASTTSGGNDNITITGNNISSTTTVADIGIQVGNGLSSTISLNTVSVENNTTTVPVAISIETGFVSSTITRNTITKSLATNTGGYGGRGITIGTGTASSALIVSNNFVAGVNGSNWSSFGNASSMGIAIGMIGASTTISTTTGGITLNYNTVNISGTFSSTTNCLTAALYVGSGASALSIQNNIFVNSLNNTGTGTSSKAYAIYSAVANTAFSAIDYNDYSISGTQGVLGFLTSDRTNLAGIVTGFGSNANSKNIAPVFTSATDLHLVPASNTALDNLGTTLITGYNIDIDGDTRPAAGGTNTDIGADEFVVVPSCASTPSPADGATGVSQTPTLTWAAATNATSYDVYFGTSSTPPFIGNQTALSYSPGALSASQTYYWKIVAKNGGTPATGCATWSFTTNAAVPTLSASTLSAFGNQCQSVASSANTFTINAVNLTGTNVTITAPTDFTVSEDGISYASSINVNHSSGSFTTKTIYVQFTPASLGAYSGNIVISGGGLASSVNVAVSGTGVNSLAGLSYTTSSVTYCTATAITANSATLTTSGGTVTYFVLPALPAGLTLNTSTGQITGNPTTATAAANYVITASNGCSSTTATVNITVITKLSALTYTTSPLTVCVGSVVNNTVSSITGSGTITYSVLPSLPSGLSINSSTGAITGTASAATASASYTITADNGCSTTTASVTIAVNSTLNGTYTVGAGGSRDYPTLTAAVAAYNTSCITGPVVFNLMDATYSGSETFPIIINANTTASSTNTLTIKPNTTATVSGTSAAGLIRLNGADYIIIDGSNSGATDKSLTITNTNTAASVAAVSLISLGTGAGATNNIVKNCNISTGGTANAGYGIAIGTTPGSSGADNDNNTIQNNTITTSSVGVYAVGTASASSGGNDNLIITGNTISSTTPIANIGIQLGNGLNSTVSLNTISVENSSTTPPVGISLETGFVSSTVTRNTITKSLATNTGGYGGRGITIGTGTASSALIISNNFVAGVNGSNWSSFGNASSMGIAIGMIGGSTTISTTAGGITLNYNTVNMSGTYSSTTNCLTTALYVGSGASALSIQNNIFVNSLNNTGTGTTSKAYSIYSAVANTAYSTINYNDYYISGTQGVLGFLTSDRTNLAGIVTGFGGNANSQNIAPVFTSSTDLHLVYSNNTALNDLGTALITGYNIDIDGETRPASGSTNTDMGADEFAAIANDAGITGLVSSAFCPGTQTVQAVIKNFGTATLTSATVDWTVNGVAQASASWTGSLATGATGTVTLGTYNFVGATSYVIAVTSSLPNGVTDPNPGNNTFTSSSFQTALSGTYTVGSGGNYTTLTAAVAAANTNGICGPTIFNLTDATYGGGETFPIVINSLSGASAVNTLTIKPGSGVNASITGSNAAAIIKLNGADYITIDGSNNGTSTRNLTIANTNTGTSSAVIWLASVASPADGATNNTIKNTIIKGQAPTTTFAGVVTSGSTVGAFAEAANANNTISNNEITAAAYGIGVSGVVGNESGNSVTNNAIGSVTAGSKIGYRGIFIANQQNITVTGNSILGVVTTTSNTTSGIYVGGTISGGTVSQNTISDIKNTNTTGFGSNGIQLFSTSTAANLLLSNNFISDVASYGYTLSVGVSDNGYGIVIDNNGGGYKIYHNTINLTTNQTTGTSAAINIVSAASAGLDIRNNIFANSQTTNTRYAIYSGAANTVFSNIDYNDYYSAGTLGYIGSARADLTAIQTGFGSNTNSKNITPVFTSSTDLRLIPASNASLDDLGSTAILGTVAIDIDGEGRPASGSTNPDMGADEFVRPANDAGITGLVTTAFCPGSQSVQAVLKNFGTATLTSATINWTVNGAAQTPVSWTGSLATNATANVTLGNFTFAASTSYVIAVTSSLPNGAVDPTPSNNTFTSASFQTALSGTYTVGAAGNYSTLTAAVAAANAYGLCGPTIFNLIDATYSGSETFPIVINQLTGASAVNTLTIKPASGVNATITGSNAVAILKLNGADYITIDGSNNGTTT